MKNNIFQILYIFIKNNLLKIIIILFGIIFIIVLIIIYNKFRYNQIKEDLNKNQTAKILINPNQKNSNILIEGLNNDYEKTVVNSFESEIKPGKYLITIYKNDYSSWQEVIEINKGDYKKIKVNLEKTSTIEEGAP